MARLNFKSDRAWKLASHLSAQTGETLTAAVTIAQRERLAQRKAQDDRATPIDADADDRGDAAVEPEPRRPPET